MVFAGAHKGGLWASEDGGASWEPQMHLADNPKGLHLYAVRRIAGTLFVVGDLMLDGYVYGEVERISPEAPAPVLAVRRELPAGPVASLAWDEDERCLRARRGRFELVCNFGREAVRVDLGRGRDRVEPGLQRLQRLDGPQLLKLYRSLLADGRVKLTDTMPVSERAWRTQGSKMFVELGSRHAKRGFGHRIVETQHDLACCDPVALFD